MPFTPEDGTGLADANSYATEAEADDYFEDRGQTTAWDAITDKEGALVRGSSYIEAMYGSRWPGTRLNGRGQALGWPREDGLDQSGEEIAENAVPVEVKYAAFEAALREGASPGSLTPDYASSARVTHERVDVLEVSYSDSSTANTRPIITMIDELLAPLIGPRSSTMVTWPLRA